MFTLTNTAVGAGVLSLPWAFKLTGGWVANLHEQPDRALL